MVTQAVPRPSTPSLPSTPGPKTRNRLHSLTGWRAVAAGMVFLYHMTSMQVTPFTPHTAATAIHWFSNFGAIGVSFFFILSGFVLTWSVREGENPARFWRRRLVRIFPNHVVTLFLALWLFAGSGDFTGVPATRRIWLPNLFLLHAWRPRLEMLWGVNPPSWSLSCEALFYLCFPLLYFVIRRIRPGLLWASATFLTALVLTAPVLAYNALPKQTGPSMFGMPVSVQQFWFVYAFPPVRMVEFMLGMVLARIVLLDRWIRIPVSAAALAAVGGYLLTFKVPYLYRFEAATVIPLALLIAASAAHEGAGGRSFMRNRVMVRLGELSFAFFMIHAVMLVTLTKLFAGHKPWTDGQAYGVIAAYLTICLASAWVLNTFVERPLVKYLSEPRRLRPAR